MTLSTDGPRSPSVRPIRRADLPALKAVIASNGLFPPEMLDDMTASVFGPHATDDHWLTLDDGEPVAVAYFAPERMTVGAWNLYLIAVRSDRKGQGLGTRLIAHVERLLAERGERILLVETSGLPEFELTRRFYDRRGYEREARIRDFYQAGEDKVVFWKSLQSP
ncbi:MAG TPA: GNAT family N-acetyltransferase [Mesorhizobium sp.]|jgi:ribosomal protein S18 acetylase RimI-like enzyme|nr:GNAT family N-acetyltransferase [Mesorhizobium sp.]